MVTVLDLKSLANRTQSDDAVQAANALVGLSLIFRRVGAFGGDTSVFYKGERGEIYQRPLCAGSRVDMTGTAHLVTGDKPGCVTCVPAKDLLQFACKYDPAPLN